MEGIDRAEVDEAIVKTFDELKRAVDTYSRGSVELQSSALRALTLLREQVVADERGQIRITETKIWRDVHTHSLALPARAGAGS